MRIKTISEIELFGIYHVTYLAAHQSSTRNKQYSEHGFELLGKDLSYKQCMEQIELDDFQRKHLSKIKWLRNKYKQLV